MESMLAVIPFDGKWAVRLDVVAFDDKWAVRLDPIPYRSRMGRWPRFNTRELAEQDREWCKGWELTLQYKPFL